MEPLMETEDAMVEERAVAENKDRFLPVSILVAAVIIGGSLVFSAFYRGAANGGPAVIGNVAAGVPQGAAQPALTADAMKLGARDAVLGDANAPVTVIEYGDYQCPFCSRFFANIQPQIIQKYVNTGKVKFVFRDFSFLGPESTAAAEAAACAEDQNKLWAYHDALYAAKYADFNKGGREDNGFFNRALFVKLAGDVGLDAAAFANCIDTHKDAAIIQAENTAAQGAGVNSTPTTFVNGKEVAVNGQSAGADPAAIMQAISVAVGS